MPSIRVGLYLPYLYPPETDIPLPGGCIRAVSDDEIETEFGDHLTGDGLTYGEMRILNRKNPERPKGKRHWAVFERTSADPTDDTILALLDVVSGDWRHRFRVPVSSPLVARPMMGISIPRAVRRRRLTPEFVRKLRPAMAFGARDKRLAISLHRWRSSFRREDHLEAILDCCSALESIVGLEQELRLRLAFSVGEILRSGKKDARRIVYRLYGIRNKFVHGSDIPAVSWQEREEFVVITSLVLREVVSVGRRPKSLDEARLLSI